MPPPNATEHAAALRGWLEMCAARLQSGAGGPERTAAAVAGMIRSALAGAPLPLQKIAQAR